MLDCLEASDSSFRRPGGRVGRHGADHVDIFSSIFLKYMFSSMHSSIF
jgi:hypothetical protein